MCMIAVEILDSRTKSTLQSEKSIAAAADYLLSHTTISKVRSHIINIRSPFSPACSMIVLSHLHSLYCFWFRCAGRSLVVSPPQVLAMVTMTRAVKGVMEELLSEEGQSFFVHPATRYIRSGEHASFFEVASRALMNREILVGYRPVSNGITIVNPKAKDVARVWQPYDLIIVCCETTSVVNSAGLNLKRIQRYAGLGGSVISRLSEVAAAGKEGKEAGITGADEEGEEEDDDGTGSSSSGSSTGSADEGRDGGLDDNNEDDEEEEDDDDSDDDIAPSGPPIMKMQRRTSVAMDPTMASFRQSSEAVPQKSSSPQQLPPIRGATPAIDEEDDDAYSEASL